MATKDKKKAPAASKKGKKGKREQDAMQPAGKPVEPVKPEPPVPQEPQGLLEPPENWGSPFRPTKATTASRAMQEMALLLKIGKSERASDVLAMPEFVNRLLWIRDCGGIDLSRQKCSWTEAMWVGLKASASSYISSMCENEWRNVYHNPYASYDPPKVSETILQLPAITDQEDGRAFIVSNIIIAFASCCQMVAKYSDNDEDFINEVYAGEHEMSGDGNDFWKGRWRMEPDKWTKFHETFQKRCAELQEPMEAPAVGTVAPEARRGKGNRRGKRGKQFSTKCQMVMDAFFKHENLDIRPYGNRLNYKSLVDKYLIWVKGEGKTFDPRGEIEAELKEHGGSVLEDGIKFYVATWRQKRRQK